MKRIIVDKDDTILGAKSRDEIDFATDIYRVSALWLWNSKGEVLIAQRAFNKGNGAGLWGPSVAGTVEEGETYDDNIRKETEEEIGVSDVEFEFVQKDFFAGTRSYFCSVYKVVKDVPEDEFVIQQAEVAAVRWITPDDLRADFAAHPEKYLPSFEQCLGSLRN